MNYYARTFYVASIIDGWSGMDKTFENIDIYSLLIIIIVSFGYKVYKLQG